MRAFSVGLSDKFKKYIFDVEIALQVNLNHEYLMKRFKASEFVMNSLLKLYRPKMFFCTVAYPIMGYVCAAKKMNIPVIEFQHGYIGTSHRAYNVSANIASEAYPDFVACWGEYEAGFFKNPHNYYVDSSRVYTVGNFYTDYLREADLKSQSISSRNKFNVLIAVTMQDPVENQMLEFVKRLAELDPTQGFLILPRNRPHAFYDNWALDLPNVFTDKTMNSYQGIACCNVHTTCWSTMAFEALVLGKPNILIDENRIATNSLGDTLGQTEFTYYADSPSEFMNLVQKAVLAESNQIKQSSERFFQSKSTENVENAVKEIKVVTNLS